MSWAILLREKWHCFAVWPVLLHNWRILEGDSPRHAEVIRPGLLHNWRKYWFFYSLAVCPFLLHNWYSLMFNDLSLIFNKIGQSSTILFESPHKIQILEYEFGLNAFLLSYKFFISIASGPATLRLFSLSLQKKFFCLN